ncbi:MAG: CopG family transcriptional regulator [Candidatus Omnitrophica bacterium]|jgi:predicted DNA binding CopG/RHH family protein|nr:CopG family transcriptional regulator [Candidatus Omnitrophota bacterium]
MKRKIDDLNMPIGKLVRVKDFLPAPAELVNSDKTIKVTIVLKKKSVDFFKQQARQCHTKYQKMIRELLDRYAVQYS